MPGIYYTTKGPLRGKCGHSHKDIAGAVRCRAADEALCVSKGGHTDRRVFAAGVGVWRELDESEVAAVTALRESDIPRTRGA